MARYALLTRESSNRVFGASAPALLASEVEALGGHLSGGILDGHHETWGGLHYYCFDSTELSPTDRFVLSNLALARGLFAVEPNGALQPLEPEELQWFESDLTTIQRYVGKTNEQFTHLLVNLAVASSTSAHDKAAAGERVSMLDPVSGRGSTLNRGLTYGFNVAGIEVDEAHVDQHRVFLVTYLKNHRVKHKAETERIRKGELAGTSAFEVAIRPGSPALSQHVRVARASTDQSASIFRAQQFDVIAGDLPYGAHHVSHRGSHRAAKGKTVSKGNAASGTKRTAERSPERLVKDSIAGWRKVMAPGGSIALSWNVQTLPREHLADLLTDVGLEVVEHPRSFVHDVDRQITRDLLVGRRPDA